MPKYRTERTMPFELKTAWRDALLAVLLQVKEHSWNATVCADYAKVLEGLGCFTYEMTSEEVANE